MPVPGDFTSVRTNANRPSLITKPRQWWSWFVSAAICWFTKSHKSHSFTYYGDHNGVESIGEAQPGGYHISPLSDYADQPLLWSTEKYPLDPTQSQIARQTMDEFAGARGGRGITYGFVDIAAIAIGIILGWHAPQAVRDRLAGTRTLICSQAVDVICERMGVHLFHGVPDGDVTPGMLDALLEP